MTIPTKSENTKAEIPNRTPMTLTVESDKSSIFLKFTNVVKSAQSE